MFRAIFVMESSLRKFGTLLEQVRKCSKRGHSLRHMFTERCSRGANFIFKAYERHVNIRPIGKAVANDCPVKGAKAALAIISPKNIKESRLDAPVQERSG